MITYTNSINMYTGSIPLVIHVNQYDSDFTLVFNLYSSAGAFNVESGTTASIRGTKTDGNGYTANATIDISNRRVTVTGHVQMTATAGRNVYELVLTKSNKDIATANFILDCEPAAMDADTIQSETVLKELNAIIESAQTAVEAAERAEEAATHLTIDTTLTQSGQAADAKVVGDELGDLRDDLNHVGLSESVKVALLNCFAHTAWTDEHGQEYYDTLEAALYEVEYPRITAVFNSGTHSIYNAYTLNDLKQYLTVKYYEDEDDEGQVIASANYTLTGSLESGNSVIRVSYDGLSTTFVVPVLDFYNKYHWNSNTDVDVLSYYHGLAGTYSYDGVGTVKLDNASANDRRILIGKYGYTPILDTDGVSGSIYYGMPIPENASSITITVDSAFDISVQWKKYEGDDYIYSWIGDSGWQNGPSYTSDIVVHTTRGRANVFWLNVRRHDNGTITSNPVIDVVFE